jgi:hypothetical protein
MTQKEFTNKIKNLEKNYERAMGFDDEDEESESDIEDNAEKFYRVPKPTDDKNQKKPKPIRFLN